MWVESSLFGSLRATWSAEWFRSILGQNSHTYMHHLWNKLHIYLFIYLLIPICIVQSFLTVLCGVHPFWELNDIHHDVCWINWESESCTIIYANLTAAFSDEKYTKKTSNCSFLQFVCITKMSQDPPQHTMHFIMKRGPSSTSPRKSITFFFFLNPHWKPFINQTPKWQAVEVNK